MQKINIITRIVGVLLIVIMFIASGFIKTITSATAYRFNEIFYGILVLLGLSVSIFAIFLISKPSKTLKVLPSIFLSLVTTIMCIFIAEFVISFFEPKEMQTLTSKEFDHMYKPKDFGYHYPSKYDEFKKITVTTNELGMRDASIPPQKKESRILILGDSFIQADEIPFEKTVGQKLQSKVKKNEYLIFQQGYSSWSPLLELNFLVKTFDKIKPDKVFLVLFINDFFDANVYPHADEGYTQDAIFDKNGYPIEFKLKSGSFIKSKIENSKLVNLLIPFITKRSCDKRISQTEIDTLIKQEVYKKEGALTQLNNLDLLENMIRLSRRSTEWDQETKKTVELSFKYILKMSEFLKERGVSLSVMLTPSGWNTHRNETVIGKKLPPYCLSEEVVFSDSGIRESIEEFAKNHGIEYIDLGPEFNSFKDKNPRTALFLQLDGHWSESAHLFMSDILQKYLHQ